MNKLIPQQNFAYSRVTCTMQRHVVACASYHRWKQLATLKKLCKNKISACAGVDGVVIVRFWRDQWCQCLDLLQVSKAILNLLNDARTLVSGANKLVSGLHKKSSEELTVPSAKRQIAKDNKPAFQYVESTSRPIEQILDIWSTQSNVTLSW